jgi:diguanylate cyclase (GGDEF)-like protein
LFTAIFKHCRYLLIPGGISLGLCCWYTATRIPPHALTTLYPSLPWLTLLFGGFISWRFNRSQLLFQLLLLILTAVLLRALPDNLTTARELLWLLLPVNFCLIPCLKDRGISLYSLWYPFLLLSQPFIVWALLSCQPVTLTNWLELAVRPLLPAAAGPLPPAVQWGFFLAWLVLSWRYWRHAGPQAGNLLSSLLLLFVAGSGWSHVPLEICLSLVGLSMTTAMIEISHSLAYRDDLTGLEGRRALNEMLQKLPARYCVAMLDIDHFKSVNDRYGHDTGDQVLKMVASRLQRAGRPGRPYRYGGEEFTLLFPGRSLAEALPVLEQVRKEVATAEFVLRKSFRPKKPPLQPKRQRRNKTLKVTISIGAAEAHGEKSAEQVIKKADKALYRAKQSGRNRVVA